MSDACKIPGYPNVYGSVTAYRHSPAPYHDDRTLIGWLGREVRHPIREAAHGLRGPRGTFRATIYDAIRRVEVGMRERTGKRAAAGPRQVKLQIKVRA